MKLPKIQLSSSIPKQIKSQPRLFVYLYYNPEKNIQETFDEIEISWRQKISKKCAKCKLKIVRMCQIQMVKMCQIWIVWSADEIWNSNQGEDRSTIDLASPDIRGRPTGGDDDDGHDDYDEDGDVVDCPTQLTLIFTILYMYLSVVFHNKYQSCKYEKPSRDIC